MKKRSFLRVGERTRPRVPQRAPRGPHHSTPFLLFPICLLLTGASIFANPQGMTVVSGSARSTQQGNTLQITTSRNAFLQWNSFNIAAGETTIFHEPSASSIVIDQINSANPTTIFGSLRANGIVVLENQSGFYFGPNAFVKAGGLVVTTAAINPWSSGGGAGWSFDGPPAATPIVNYGHLETASGGSMFLIGQQIENHGTMAAPGGTAALLAGQKVLLSSRPDGLSLSVPVQLPAGSVDNQGRIVADAGQVLLQAQTVNNSGVIQANSVREKNGVIEFYASDDIQLAGSSILQANGGTDGISPGGNITIKSGGTFSDSTGSQITATGGANGGNGGNVDVSAPNVLSLNSRIDASARAGWSEGLFSLDPENIVLGTTGTTGPDSSGTINGTGSSGTLNVNVNTAFQNITSGQILLEASGNITLNSGTTWNLSTSTGKTSGQLTLEAGGNITLGATGGGSATIADANDWSVTLEAGYCFASGQVVSGAGTVTLNGTSAINTAAGNISVLAGNNVTVGSGGIVSGVANGAVMAGTGGNVSVQALAGNVACGSSTGGYIFTQTGVGYTVSPNLGGISTASGGNVNIQAGGNITAALPSGPQNRPSDFGSGAFGAAPGDVNVTAGGNVTGHYVLANGTGTITAGMNAGIPGNSLALSLIKGGWTVNAANNIYLQEVRNPNGVFNSSPLRYPVSYLFNYDPLASVTLEAGNGVTITGGSTSTALPRVIIGEDLIFPPILTIDAGAGGISFDDSVNLFPSPEGTLNLTTTRGGNLQGSGNGIAVNLSDSARVSYAGGQSFQYGDADENALLHLNDPNPVLIHISGSAENLTLDSSKPVEMYVAGNIENCAANIYNLRPTDTTTISAGGEIIQRDNFVIISQLQPGQTPDFNALDLIAVPTILDPYGVPIGNPNLNPILQNIENSFNYDPTTRSLLYIGAMSIAQENALLAIHFLDKTDLDYIQQQSQYESSGTALTYTIAGPGTLRINAASMMFGNEGGIISEGFGSSSGLVPVTLRGADVDILVSGDINMTAASIQSEYGGNINIRAGGSIDIGSPLLESIVNSEEASGDVFGITSVWGGNINVIANGNVNVDSSRIAAYDGGNIFVESLQGNVNAGTGGNGAVLITKPYLDGKGNITFDYDFIPGSGIMATSFPQLVYGQTSQQIGNIAVETPEGDIVASRGGIVQLSLTPAVHNDASINLNAGSKNSDGSIAYVGNVDASGSGIVGGQVNITATGNVNGLVVASVGANVSAVQNVSATVLSQGGATVTAGQTVSGIVVGGATVSVSGAKDVAAAFSGSGSVNESGAVSGAAAPPAATGSPSSAAAATGQQVAEASQPSAEVASNTGDDDDQQKKKQKTQLTQYVGRVTVLLPK
jgi:filamentous hemagglutinin family protein